MESAPGGSSKPQPAGALLPLLPGGDALEPVPLGLVLLRAGGGGGGNGSSWGVGVSTGAGAAPAENGAGSGQPALPPQNLWRLIYRDRLVSRGACTEGERARLSLSLGSGGI